MAYLTDLQSLLFALMGWGATVLAIEGASRLTLNDRRAMVVCCWMIWMIPGFGGLVLRGLMSTDTAALYVGLTTGAMGLIVLLGALPDGYLIPTMCRPAPRASIASLKTSVCSTREAPMIPDRDYFLAQREVEARRKLAAEERLARQARHAAEAADLDQTEVAERPRGAMGWLRRLAGARQ